MEAVGIHGIELILLLLMILVVALAALAKRIETPYPIVMVIGGLIISFLPHVPKVALNPDIVFLVILPPLLFSAAYVTSWRAFRFNLVSIAMLAFVRIGGIHGSVSRRGIAMVTAWIHMGHRTRARRSSFHYRCDCSDFDRATAGVIKADHRHSRRREPRQ